MARTHIDAYQAVQTATADAPGVVLMLLDGALRFLGEARRALDRGDVAGFARGESRAHAIVAELASCLDHEAGGPVAVDLARLYDFALRHLTEGLLARNGAHLDRVRDLLREIHEGFEGAAEAVRRGAR